MGILFPIGTESGEEQGSDTYYCKIEKGEKDKSDKDLRASHFSGKQEAGVKAHGKDAVVTKKANRSR